MPNITGKISSTTPSNYPIIFEGGASIDGAFKNSKQETRWGGQAERGSKYITELKFDAHDSNPVYQDGSEVRPKNYTIRIWKRTA